MINNERKDLCLYRLCIAKEYLEDAQKALGYEMYDTAANRSYYAIFHSVRALQALSGKEFRKHSGVISGFQMDYIKTGIFEKRLSDIIKHAFSLRTESDYEDFFIISREEVAEQVTDAKFFHGVISKYIDECLSKAGIR